MTAASTVLAGSVELKPYLALRKKLATSLAIETIIAAPSAYRGKVIELRGTACGISRNENGVSLILSTGTYGSHLISAAEPPVPNPGVELACLVKIGPGCRDSLSDLILIACIYNSELQRHEDISKPAVVKHNAKPEPAPTRAKPEAANTQNIVKTYANAIKRFNAKLSDSQADTIARSILGFSGKYKVDARLVCAVIVAESNFRIDAKSCAGACGLGQLMPGTAAGMGITNPYDPVENIYGSVRYIKSMLERTSRGKDWNELTWYDLAKALAAYNAGPGAVKKHGGIPPYRETQNYVKRVISIYKQLCGVE